ncbi:MAG: RsmG family class I SAM-dependent methyltransferase [Bacteriovoracaceae bacterium]
MRQFAREYFDLLVGEYKGINLTRITNFDEFYNKQILDSIEPLNQSRQFKASILSTGLFLDIGFGGGFPILPLAHSLPQIKFLGVETRNKKVKVVREIANKLGLSNVKLVHERIENILIDAPVVCSLKAVGKIDDFLSRINVFAPDVIIYFYKGPNFFKLEEEALKNVVSCWNVVEQREITIPGTEKRYLIGFKPKKVPHGTNTINVKQLVKVSDIT